MGNHDFIYYNEVVKPALVGLAGPWISGGIEFNWPQHHRPTTFMPLEAVEEENPDGGKTVWTGEVEPFGRMKGMAGITVDKGRSYIKTKVRVYNRTAFPQVFMWWANLAVPVNDDYRTVFPPDCEWVNDHDRRAVLEWPIAKGVYKTARPYDFGKGTDLSLYWFDKAHNGKKALCCMEKALKYHPEDPRFLLQYEQLLKNTNASIEERLSVYDKYPELLKERDDCYLDKLTLLSQQGKYEEAINMAAVKHFHIYEGGEGKLTKQHAWMHVLYGNELVKAGDTEKAEQIYMNGINMPKSYGEAKTFFNQEAHIYYYLSKLYSGDKRTAALQKAAEYKAAVSEISLFRALALKELGKEDEAKAVLDEMLNTAQSLIDNKDMRTYYGVGSPSPMPFELDIEKHNLLAGNTLKAFALYGLGQYSEAELCIRRAAELDPNDFAVYTYRQITK